MVFYANRSGPHHSCLHPRTQPEKLLRLESCQACCRRKLAIDVAVVASATTELKGKGRGHGVPDIMEMCKLLRDTAPVLSMTPYDPNI